MKKDIYIIVMALIIGAMFGLAHIESCAKKRDENRVIVYNISHFETEDIEIEEKTHSIEPVGYEIKTIEDSEVPSDVMAAAEKYGAIYDICPELLEAVAWKETRYTSEAISADGSCIGICQVNPKWHKERMNRLGVTDLTDVEGNIAVAADYLHVLFEEHPGDPEIALMIYNGDHSYKKGNISRYAQEIVNKSQELERKHGK